MKKKKYFQCSRFLAEVFSELLREIRAVLEGSGAVETFRTMDVSFDNIVWSHDSFDEFLSDYRTSTGACYFSYGVTYEIKKGKKASLDVVVSFFESNATTSVEVSAPDRSLIERIFDVFERNSEKAKIIKSESRENRPVIFIGHGHGIAWRDLKDHLQDQHGYQIEAYETGARAGHTIRDILVDMSSKSSFALLVLTGDDFPNSEFQRARQNVVHETGLFQGKLGFERAIVLLEEGVEEFSNLFGIQQIRFSKGNIRETFGDVLATLRREFG